jgi:hypothetical protein
MKDSTVISGASSEIGRELKVSELKLKTVVVLHKPERPFITAWVVAIDDRFVCFALNKIGMGFLAQRQGDGIIEDTGTAIQIFEYLGEI